MSLKLLLFLCCLEALVQARRHYRRRPYHRARRPSAGYDPNCKVDFLFIFDVSGTETEHLGKLVAVAKRMIELMEIGPGARHQVGAMAFSAKGKEVKHIPWGQYQRNKGELLQKIQNVKIDGATTYLSGALEFAYKEFMTKGRRPGAKLFTVVLHDGIADNPRDYYKPIAKKINELPQSRIVAIGIGPPVYIHTNTLREIASDSRLVFTGTEVDTVMDQVAQVGKQLLNCEGFGTDLPPPVTPRPPPATTTPQPGPGSFGTDLPPPVTPRPPPATTTPQPGPGSFGTDLPPPVTPRPPPATTTPQPGPGSFGTDLPPPVTPRPPPATTTPQPGPGSFGTDLLPTPPPVTPRPPPATTTPQPGPGKCKIDLLIVLDLSQTTTGDPHDIASEEALKLVDRFRGNFGRNGGRVGLITFSGPGTTKTVFSFNKYRTGEQMKQAMRKVVHKQTGTTRIIDAQDQAIREFTRRKGARIGGALQVIVFLTDGMTPPDQIPKVAMKAPALKAKAQRVYAVSAPAGSYYGPDNLKALASDPGKWYRLTVPEGRARYERDMDLLFSAC